MLLRLLVLSLLLPYSSFSQEWKTYNSEDFGSFTWTRGYYVDGNRQFKVNPYNGSIWCANRNIIHGIDVNGEYFRFDEDNCYIIQPPNWGGLAEFAFTKNDTYVCDKYNGIIKFNGTNWSYLYHGEWMRNIFAEEDTVYALFDDSDEILTWVNGSPGETLDPLLGFEKITVQDGRMYGSSNIPRGSLTRQTDSSYYLYHPDSSLILNVQHFDIKHSPNRDLLFVAHEQGISIAENGIFYDSITPDNSWNMPEGAISEIEVDSLENVWALFGGLNIGGWSFDSYHAIAYYDRKTRTWSRVYTPNNSPLELIWNISIELGPNDNLYIADYNKLHVVKFNSQWPESVNFQLKQREAIQVHPNPSSGIINFTGAQLGSARTIIILDELQRKVAVSEFSYALDLSQLSSGTYWVEVWGTSELMARERLVKIQ